MGSLVQSDVQRIEKRKRFLFLGTGLAGVAATLGVSGWVGIPLLALSGWMGKKWWEYRVEKGIRF